MKKIFKKASTFVLLAQASPTATATATPTSTATASALPATGTGEVTLFVVGAGMILLFAGLLVFRATRKAPLQTS